jgi:hypothetical protein
MTTATAGAARTTIRLDFRVQNEISGFQLIFAAPAGDGPPLLVGHCEPARGVAVLYRSAGWRGRVPLGHAGTVRGGSQDELRARARARLLLGGPWWIEAGEHR